MEFAGGQTPARAWMAMLDGNYAEADKQFLDIATTAHNKEHDLQEAQALTAMMTEDRAVLTERLVAMGARAALVTGGHGAEPVDHLFDGLRHIAIPVARHGVAATHGLTKPPVMGHDPCANWLE